MTHKLLTAFAFVLLLFVPLQAKKYQTGDEQLDRWLVNIDFVAEQDINQYLTELAKKHQLEFGRLVLLRSEYEFSASEICSMIALHKATKRNFDDLIMIFNQYRNQKFDQLLKAAGAEKSTKPFADYRSLIENQAPKRDLEAESRNIFIKKQSD